MSIIPASGCCCGESALFDCPVRQLCVYPESKDWWDTVRAEYITVGQPRGPTVFPGTYWAAWHNGMHPDSELTVDMTIDVVKRTVVQETCSGTCPAVTVPTGADCGANTFLTATAGCKQTAYTDNFNWNMTGTLRLNGVVPELEQERFVAADPYHLQYFQDIVDPSVPAADNGRPYPTIPKGYFPCGIEGPCGDPCDDVNEAVDFGTDPMWWPGENRKLMPRFFSKAMTIDTTAVPSSTYTQTAACGAVQYVNRCNTVETEYTNECCLDFPMVVLPGHSGTLCDGGNSLPCDPLNKENGADQALWGFDLLEPKLLERFEALNLPDGWYIGASNDIWLVKWTNPDTTITKIRILFDVSRKIVNPGDTLKFTTDIALVETGTITRVDTLESWRIEIDFSFTPVNWCLNAPDCGCIQSYAENAPSVLTYTASVPFSQECPGTAEITLPLAVGLEDVAMPGLWWNAVNQHGLCPCGTSCDCEDPESPYTGPAAWCFEWDELPSGGLGTPGTSENYYRFLGDEPIERGHPLWRRYRNKYNHTATTVDPTGIPGHGIANPSAYGTVTATGSVFAPATPVIPPGSCCGGLTVSAGKAIDPGATPGDPCGSTQSDYDPTCNGGEGGFVCLDEGCYDVEANDVPDGDEFWIRMWHICNPYHSCSHQILELGGGIIVTSCEIAGVSYNISIPELIVIPWDNTQSCYPFGNMGDIYVTSSGTVCDGKGAWSGSGIQVTIS